jgi:hypothetical protein
MTVKKTLENIKLRIIRFLRSPMYKIKKKWRRFFGFDKSWLFKSRHEFTEGSWQWLALSEMWYGGMKGGEFSKQNTGGDRMSPILSPTCHGYGEIYEKFLKKYLKLPSAEKLVIIEIGILNGSGLAIWCDLFPKAKVIGLDIDLANFEANRPFLDKVGAFSLNKPEIYLFNQLDPVGAASVLQQVLGESKVAIVIDDGCHCLQSIEITFNAVFPHLADQFVYFIEDNLQTYDYLSSKNKKINFLQYDEMTVAFQN